MKSAFDKIAAGLEDAIGYAEGDHRRGREGTVDVKAVRAATELSQAAFAETFHLKVATVRDWEQGRRLPDSGSLTLLRMIRADPAGVRKILARVAA